MDKSPPIVIEEFTIYQPGKKQYRINATLNVVEDIDSQSNIMVCILNTADVRWATNSKFVFSRKVSHVCVEVLAVYDALRRHRIDCRTQHLRQIFAARNALDTRIPAIGAAIQMPAAKSESFWFIWVTPRRQNWNVCFDTGHPSRSRWCIRSESHAPPTHRSGKIKRQSHAVWVRARRT